MFRHPTLVALFVMMAALAQGQRTPITLEEVESYILKQADCPPSALNQLYIVHTEHANLTRDGRDNFIIVAGTCNTGTAGPDVHSVFSRDARGNLIELPIEGAAVPAGTLFGNRNSDLFSDGAELVEDYHDTSDRKHPLIIRYRWDGQRFREASRAAAKPFQTSYDCAKATEETEQAICANAELARFDLELHAAYVKRLLSASAEERVALKQGQRNWLKQRNGACQIYKWWVECLTKVYQQRIAELQGK